jgi:hypothetical protein
MHTAMNRWLTAFFVLSLTGCDWFGVDDGDQAVVSTVTPTQERACVSFENAICAEPSPCEQAIVDDCIDVVSLLSDDLVEHTATCVDTGAPLLECLPYALFTLTPSDAHREFAAAFCSKCQPAPFVSNCEEIILGNAEGNADDDGALVSVARSIVFALGDELVRDITAECVSGLTCLVEFPSCAQEVLVKHLVPEETAYCLVSTLIAGETLSCGN